MNIGFTIGDFWILYQYHGIDFFRNFRPKSASLARGKAMVRYFLNNRLSIENEVYNIYYASMEYRL